MSGKDRSACHEATVTIGGDGREGTHYYVCSECNNPCDRTVAHNELDELFNMTINAKEIAVKTADEALEFADNSDIATEANKLLERYRVKFKEDLSRLILKERREAEIQGLSMAHYCVEDGSPEEKRINNAIKALEAEARLAEIEGSNHG